eukprot:gene11801-13022_t
MEENIKNQTKEQGRSLKKLSEESLTRPPEEVFDLLEKLGEGSYGSVFKAVHKESGEVLAIKQVPVDTDLQEIIKEISIMQQCDSPYVVKYYGSYFKNTDLWIVMEYCGAGSVSDIMRLRNKTLKEDEIACVLKDTLKGLEYLHFRRKIHRDVKAGNILLNTEGNAKLADFGVAGQLTDTMAKRNTVIGTPFWMAPEVIQEIGYDCKADIWSLGITALEMGEGKPPHADIHPMRAIFMIPTKPPPKFKKPEKWGEDFIDFVSKCLIKTPEDRASATQLLQHPFIKKAKPVAMLSPMLQDAARLREEAENAGSEDDALDGGENELDEEVPGKEASTMICQDEFFTAHEDLGTMIVNNSGESDSPENTFDTTSSDSGTMIENSGTMIENSGTMIENSGTMIENSGTMIENDMGTMVINDENDGAADDSTMRSVVTEVRESKAQNYRPAFLDHFEKLEENQRNVEGIGRKLDNGIRSDGAVQFPKNFFGPMDFDFLKTLTYEELNHRMSSLDGDMEREIEDLRKRYQDKRQPILDAMEMKKRRQMNF